MKTLKLTIGLVALSLIFGIMVSSCKKDTPTKGSMAVYMTDAPANYSEVNVEIEAVQANYAGNEWVTLKTNSGIYNLLELQNGNSVLIADEKDMNQGEIKQLRLVLGNNNSVVLKDSGSFNLEIPGALQAGININLNQEIKNDFNLKVLIDFDATKSVVETGVNTYILDPVIEVKGSSYAENK